MTTTVIETDGLTKLYGSTRGIEDVTFSVEPGEFVALVGPSGAGKTTVADLVLPHAAGVRDGLMAGAMGVAFALAVLATLYPARRAAAIAPASALRYD
mgnify:CR=1 FL=1